MFGLSLALTRDELRNVKLQDLANKLIYQRRWAGIYCFKPIINKDFICATNGAVQILFKLSCLGNLHMLINKGLAI